MPMITSGEWFGCSFHSFNVSDIFLLSIEVFKLVAFTDSFLTFQVYLFLPLADADASA